ncbi:YggS family pyridoxal phosphate-dependent enzyme [Dasania sp. GY-MA-18]|uniref:Pyridoxal phosphate homeostasis protein n=1 Tax=Dasania phycosphaerae TaxID=2950436 RepID=A0A9J6RKM9_9GAMM|nr:MULTISPECIES: YggS family pyridoxal phosphate-dependent enzyme [Dasania]MCR8922461.1 YggS family pyridoxal phosphate-dependent enzyme [Dasania sp. GY-MA-18]MCZ0864889.1 YggS family pyridoxal phosphate-dependent enzyme [Dasania phycosphaerae]MCZ0868617.1 YggS family pyridoxal phosphate-dependent enzyme [Dasania phycosphaerae]
MATTIAQNIAKLQQRISVAEQKYQRDHDSVKLMAVSKTKPAALIREAAAAGAYHIGENYLQEALEKIIELKDLDLCWHFIGPIQSNKTRPIAEHFDWVHGVDRLKIARRLSEQRPPSLPALNICLQVNVNDESSKSGVSLAELPELALAVAELPQLQLRGLMAIPKASTDQQEQRHNFAQVANAFKALQSQLPQLDTLSMGMSGDMDAAIAEGSTIVRIGTDIFGARATPPA